MPISGSAVQAKHGPAITDPTPLTKPERVPGGSLEVAGWLMVVFGVLIPLLALVGYGFACSAYNHERLANTGRRAVARMQRAVGGHAEDPADAIRPKFPTAYFAYGFGLVLASPLWFGMGRMVRSLGKIQHMLASRD